MFLYNLMEKSLGKEMHCLANNRLKRLFYIWIDSFLGKTRIDCERGEKKNYKIRKGKKWVFTSYKKRVATVVRIWKSRGDVRSRGESLEKEQRLGQEEEKQTVGSFWSWFGHIQGWRRLKIRVSYLSVMLWWNTAFFQNHSSSSVKVY